MSLQSAAAADIGSNSTNTNVSSTSNIEVVENANDLLSNSILDENETLGVGGGSFTELNELINGNTNTVIDLGQNYTYVSRDSFDDGIKINRPLTINGNGYAIDGNGMARIFNITSSVTLNNVVFIRGAVTGGNDGGALLITGDNCMISDSKFIDNVAGHSGGAIFWDADHGTITNSEFTNNRAMGDYPNGGDGGAIIWIGSHGLVDNCTFTENNANVRGGAVFLTNDSTQDCNNTTFKNSKFINNHAGTNGGAIDWHEGAIDGEVTNCTFENNTADANGGAVYWRGHHGEIKDSNFTNNTANGLKKGRYNNNGDGGAVFWSGVNGTVTNCRFIDNEAICNKTVGVPSGRGGAVYIEPYQNDDGGRNISFHDCYFKDNNAGSNGGAIDWHKGAFDGLVDNCTFINNIANRSGGAIYWSGTNGTVKKSTFTDNRATGKFTDDVGGGDGGAVLWIGSEGLVDNCTFADNFAQYRGGAVFLHNESSQDCNNTTFANCIFENNVAGLNGGGVDWQNGAHNGRLINSTFTNNTAWRSGGAVYWHGTNGTVINVTFYDNKAVGNVSKDYRNVTNYTTSGGNGGAIIWTGSIGTIENCNFTKNNASQLGGGIYLQRNENISIKDSSFSDNYAGNIGGAINWNVGAVNGVVQNTTFVNNFAHEDGGAICWNGTNGTLKDLYFYNNVAGDDGGAVFWNGTNGIIDNITCDDNKGVSLPGSNSNGGSICLTGDNVTVTKSKFSKTYAKITGGAIFITGNNVNITDSIFERCNVSHNNEHQGKNYVTGGGAIYVLGNNSNIINCTFEMGNGREGGIVYIQGHNATIANSSFEKSYAINGGSIYIKGANATISNTNISLSNATKANINEISGAGGAIFISGDNATINKTNFKITYSFGLNANAGGALYVAGHNADIVDSTFLKGTSQKLGGAIYIKGDNTTVESSGFISNAAVASGSEGGAIYIEGANTNITRSHFEHNEVTSVGGAVYIKGANTNISYSNFTDNYAASQAGAIYMVGTNSTIYGSNLTKNHAVSTGGAMYVEGLNAKVHYTYFDSNYANKGGSILWRGGYAGNEIIGSVFANSRAIGNNLQGGAIFWDEGATSITTSGSLIKDTLFINNTATHHGGAIDWYKTDNSVIDNCTFINNHISAGDGGALYCGAKGTYQGNNFTVKNSKFINNTAVTCGGAIALQMKNSLIFNNTFSGNTASYGGDIAMKEGQATGTTINNCTFSNSTANGRSTWGNHQGGSLFISDKDVSVLNSKFYNCTSLKTNGGAIFWSGENPKLINLTIVNGTALSKNAYGGAICINKNNAILINITCNDSSAYQGGGIALLTGAVKIFENVTINSCHATLNGGGIYVHASSQNNNLVSVTINDSTAEYDGGGMYINSKTVITNINLTSDSANRGGGIFVAGIGVQITNLTADECSAVNNDLLPGLKNSYGGAIYWLGNSGILENANISNSTSDYYGGGIYATGYGLKMTYINMTSNSADYGGGIYTVNADLNVDRKNPIIISLSSFDKNHANVEGGAIYSGYYSGKILNCNFTNNTADLGGAIAVASDYQNITKCSFDGNNATSSGGAIYVEKVMYSTVSDSTFTNSYAYNGGGVYNSGNSGIALFIDNCTFIKNLASHNGGAVYYVMLSTTGFETIYRDYNNFDDRGQPEDPGRTTVSMNTPTGSYPNVIFNSYFKENEDYILNVTAFAEENVAIVSIRNPKDIDRRSLFIVVNLTYKDTHGDDILVGSVEINRQNYASYFNSHDQTYNVNFYDLNVTTYNITVFFKDDNYLNKTNRSVTVTITVDTRKGDFHILQGLIEAAINQGLNNITLQRSYYFTDDRYNQTTKKPLDDSCMNITDLKNLKNFTIYGGGNIISAKHNATYGNSRIFNITAANVTLVGITFMDGNATGNFSDDVNRGGALFWAGKNGTALNCDFINNFAEYGGGIYYNSTADNCKIRGCEFYNNNATINGGAIDCNSSKMNLTNSYFEANTAGEYGAALCREINSTEGFGVNNTFKGNNAGIGGAALGWINASSIKIDGYTFIDNTAGLNGGAIYVGPGSGDCLINNSYFEGNYINNPNAEGHGGAIEWYATRGNVINSTFINNRAPTGGAIYVGDQSQNINITGSGFTNNTALQIGGAIDLAGSSVSINDSYFSENTALSGGAIFVRSVGEQNYINGSSFTSNVATDGKGGAINWNASAGQIFNTNFTNNSASYGGGIYIGGNSSNSQIVNVIFKFNNATFNGGAIDWNATGGKLYNNTFISNYAGDFGAALCREANATGGGGKNNTFISNHAGIGGAALGWIDSVGITIDEYYFYNNTAGIHGGAIFIGENSHNCTVKNSIFAGNNATIRDEHGDGGFGGAIVCLAANSTVINSRFTDNNAHEGGAIYVTSGAGNTNITGSEFRRNTAFEYGGAIGLRASAVNVNESKFYDNVAKEGGALYLGGKGITNTVSLSVFEGNNATEGYGGAINWLASSGNITDSNFTKNSAIYGGGIALGINSADSHLVNITFDGNYAYKNGGAIDCNASRMTLYNTTFKNNIAEEFGAALCREVNATGGSGKNNTFIANHAGIAGAALGWMGSVGIKIDTYFFYNNTAGRGGGAIYVSPTSHNCTIINSTFDGNRALNDTIGHGGAIDCHASNATVVNSTFSNNRAFEGGAINVESSSGNTRVTNSSFSYNVATSAGGALNVEGSSVTLNYTDFYYNRASNGGALFVGGEGITNYVYYSKFVGNNASNGNGGAIDWVASAGHIIYSNFTENFARYGGGVYLNGNSRDSNIDHAIFDNNRATVNGGAIDWNATGGNLTNTLFKNNYAAAYGAALCREANSTGGFGYNNSFIANSAGIAGAALGWLEAKGIKIDHYTFINNSAGKSGGAIYVGDGSDDCKILNSTFEGNNVLTGRGGDVDWVASNGYVYNSTFTNSISTNGGSMYVGANSENVTILNSTFTLCRSLNDGGALEIHGDNANITNDVFISSFTFNHGAAIMGINADNATITNTTFKYSVSAGAYDIYGKSSGDGGAIYWKDSSNLTVSNSTFLKNEAHAYGSALCLVNCNDTFVYNSTFDNETAGNGIISVSDSVNTTIKLTKFNNGASIFNGGAIYIDNSNANISDSDFDNVKSAWGYGGIIYVNGNATMNNLTLNEFSSKDGIGAGIYFQSGNSTLTNSSLSGSNAIWINKGANVTLTTNNNTDNSGIYSVWNAGNLWLEKNIFDSYIYNDGDIWTNTTTKLLNNETWNTTWMEIFTFWANITDDNNNSIISVRTLNTSNDVYQDKDNSYILYNNTFTSPAYFQGAFHLTAFDNGLHKNRVYNGTLNVKMPVTLKIDVGDVTQENFDVTISLTPKARSNFTIDKQIIKFKIGDKEIPLEIQCYEKLIDGFTTWILANATKELGHLPEGTYTVTASYAGDEVHLAAYNITQFTIKLRETWIKIIINNITYGQRAIANVTTNANGTVLFSMNGRNVRENITDGKIDVVLPTILNPGNYSMSVVYLGNEYYKYALNQTAFEVYYLNSTLKVIPTNISYGEDEIINVTLNNNTTTGHIMIEINGREYVAPILNGTAMFNIDGLPTGKYENITAYYKGDIHFNGNSTNFTFTVNATKNFEMDVKVDDINFGQNATVRVLLKTDATGNVTIKVDDNIVETVIISNGTAVLGNISGLAGGEHIVNVTYNGDSSYAVKSINNTKFMVHPTEDWKMGIYGYYAPYGKNSTINVTTAPYPLARDNVTIIIDNVTYIVPIGDDGNATLILNNLSAGRHNGTVTYLGDANYSAKTSKFYPSINQATPTITLSNTTNDVIATLSKSGGGVTPTGSVTFNVNGAEYTVDLTGDRAVLNDKLVIGNNSVTATYNGDQNYTIAKAKANYTIDKLLATVNVTVNNTVYGKVVEILVRVGENQTGSVKIEVNGKYYMDTLNNREAKFNIIGLNVNEYTVNVYYSGDSSYLSENNSTKFNVTKANMTANVTGQNVTSLENISFIISDVSPSDFAGKVNITAAKGVSYDGDIKGLIVMGKLPAGNYTANVTFYGDNNYNNNTLKVKFTVSRAASGMSVNISDATYPAAAIAEVHVNNHANGTVNITVDNKVFNETVRNGIAYVNLEGLSAGDKVANVKFFTDDEYNDNMTATAKFRVYKNTSAIEIEVKEVYRVGEEIVITFRPTNATGTITASINGKAQQVNKADNTTTLPDGLAEGTYTIIANLAEDTNYESSTNFKVFNVTKNDINITLSGGLNVNYVGTPIVLTAELNETVNGTVVFTINGVNYTSEVNNANKTTYSYTPVNNATLDIVAVFVGNEKYNANSSNPLRLDVQRLPSSVTLSNVTIEVGETAKFVISVTEGATGVVNVTVNGETQSVGLVDSNATVYVTGLDSNQSYPITVKYLGDDKYEPSDNLTNNVNVKKASNYVYAVIASDTIVGGSSTVTVFLPTDADGNVTIGDKSVKVQGGKGVIVLDKETTAGEKTVYVNYTNDSKYDNITNAPANYNVSKASSSVNITVGNIYIIGDTVVIEVNPVNGTANVTINGNNYTLVNTNVTFTANKTGIYNVVATIEESRDYYGSRATATFNIFEASSAIKIEVGELYRVGETFTIKYEAINSTGPITVTINGKAYKVINNETIIPGNLTEGTYIIVANLANDTQYGPATSSKVFNVVKNNITITLKDVSGNIYVGTPIDLTAELNETVNGTVVFTINGANYTVQVNNANKTTYTYTPVNNDTLRVFATFVENVKYNANSTGPKTVDVAKVASEITLSDVRIEIGETAKIIINVTDGATGTVNVTVNHITQSVGLVDSKAIVYVSDLENDTYSIAVKYLGDEKYAESENNNHNIYVNKTTSFDFTVVASDTVVGGNSTVTVILPGDADGIVTINGKSANVENGKAVIVLNKETTAGEKEITAYYTGGSKYADNSTNAKYNVSKAPSSVNITVGNVYIIGDTVTITLSYVNGTPTVKINNADYTMVKDQITFKANKTGEYNVVATIEGNDSYYGSSAAATFNIFEASSAIEIEVGELYKVGETFTIKYEAINSTGPITVTINGKAYKVINNETVIPGNLTEGTYTIVANLANDTQYGSATSSKVFNVVKNNITITLNDVSGVIYVGSPVKFTAELNETVNGTVIFNINNVSYTVQLNNGNKTSYTYTPVNNDTLTVVATFAENDMYYADSTDAKVINVKKLPTYINVTVDSPIVVGDNAVFEITMDPSINAIVTLNLSGKTYSVAVKNGAAKYIVSGLDNATYMVNASFAGDDMYLPSSNVTTLYVNKVSDYEIKVITGDIEVGNNATILIVLPSDADGELVVKVNNTEYPNTIVNGIANVIVEGLDVGRYEVNVTYKNDSKYVSKDKNSTFFNVNAHVGYDVILTVENHTFGENTIITVEVPKDIKENVTIVVDGDEYSVKANASGIATLSLNNLSGGLHYVAAIYEGDSHYLGNSNFTSFVVSRAQSEIGIDFNTPVFVGDDVIVNISMPQKINGSVILTVGDDTYSIIVKDGNATYTLKDLMNGTYAIKATFEGNENYTQNSSAVKDLVVSKIPGSINVTVLNKGEIVVGQDVELEIELSLPIDGSVIVNVNDKTYYVKVSNGKAPLALSNLKSGNYTVTVSYSDDRKYDISPNSTKFEVLNKIDSSTVMNVTITQNGTNATVYVELPSNATGNVTVVIDGKVYNITNVTEGIAVINVTDIMPGNHTVEVIYSGDGNYTGTNNVTDVNIPKISDYVFEANATGG
ncbi:Ig-like domain repeat protein, partial [Methanobrevibacter millerae]|uniref:Ig-like domain repeat protein n=1 Tax=Methanobrevibacter millerae TaxID=230361 RepID=UPI00165F3236